MWASGLLDLTSKPVGWVSYHTGLSHDFIIINLLKLTSGENRERATFTTGKHRATRQAASGLTRKETALGTRFLSGIYSALYFFPSLWIYFVGTSVYPHDMDSPFGLSICLLFRVPTPPSQVSWLNVRYWSTSELTL